MGTAARFIGKAIGIGKKKGVISEVSPEPVTPVAATPEQRAEAARGRARRTSRRGLMTPGRTLGGGSDQGTKATLGP